MIFVVVPTGAVVGVEAMVMETAFDVDFRKEELPL